MARPSLPDPTLAALIEAHRLSRRRFLGRGIVVAGGMVVLPIAGATSAPAPAISQDAILAELATPEPEEAVTVVAAGRPFREAAVI